MAQTPQLQRRFWPISFPRFRGLEYAGRAQSVKSRVSCPVLPRTRCGPGFKGRTAGIAGSCDILMIGCYKGGRWSVWEQFSYPTSFSG